MENTMSPVTRTDYRYFAYGIAPKGGVIYYGKAAMDNDDIDFWAIEARGYKGKRGAEQKTSWFIGQRFLLHYREIGIVKFVLEYTVNECGNERPLRYQAVKLSQTKFPPAYSPAVPNML